MTVRLKSKVFGLNLRGAVRTGLEPANLAVTELYDNQLH